jgi:imidazolonepropionase-like amidohydrolase
MFSDRPDEALKRRAGPSFVMMAIPEVRMRVAAILLLAVLPVRALNAAESARPTLALVGGQVIDGYEGPPIHDGVVLIAGDRIVAVGPRSVVTVPSGTTVIDTEGMSVLPGLMDMHVHLMLIGHADYEHWDKTYMPRFRTEIMPIAARQLLMAGVTTARELGAPLDDILDVKRRIEKGEIPGPRLFVSGPFIQKKPYFDYEKTFRWGVDSPDDARAKVQRLVDAGVDVIKLIDQDQLTDEEVAAVVETAHRGGKPVVAHAHREDEIRVGLKHGVDCFEHTGLATEPGYPDDILSAIRKRNNTLYWCPTIEGLFLADYTARVFPERLDDPAWRQGVPKDIADDIRQSLRNVTALDYFTLTFRRLPTLAKKFQQLRESGVTMMVGTDSGIPGNFHTDSTWRELDTWVRLGMTPMQAIGGATRWPARFLKKEKELGTLAPGRLADVIAVHGDVLTHVDLLQRVDVVVKNGVRVK